MQIYSLCTKPPKGLVWQVRRSLRWFEADHLDGLELILLVDQAPPLTDDLPEWIKNYIIKGVPIYGWYSPSQDGAQLACITLCVQQIYHSIPQYLWWSTIPTLRIIRTLAHEVAHHLFQIRGFIDHLGEIKKDEELLADKYAARILQTALSQWQYQLGSRLAKEIAFWNYSQGIIDWKAKKYEVAAEHFFKAWDLDPELSDVELFYLQAKEMTPIDC